MRRLIEAEVIRNLSRRLVRVLILVAGAVIVITGVAVLATADPLDHPVGERPAVEQFEDDADPRVLTSLYPPENPDAAIALGPAFFFLLMGFVAGASMTGAEWRAGTLTTLLTWEPRRHRVVAAKLLAAGGVALFLTFVLELLFCAAFLPTVFLRGTTQGADAAWFLDLMVAILRLSLLTGGSAVMGGAIALVARNTAGAIGASFAYFIVAEPLVRVLGERTFDSGVDRFLPGNLIAAALTTEALDTVSRGRASATLVLYLVATGLVAALIVARRDAATTG